MFDDIVDSIIGFFFDMFKGGTETFLDMVSELFQKSVDTVRDNVSETPTEFSANLVESLKVVSDTAILPVAGLIITYVFVYELYQLVINKNKGGEFEVGEMLFLIIKTAVIIMLVTNSFEITLAIFDLGKWITDQVPESSLKIPDSVADNVLDSMEDGNVGQAISMWIISAIVMIATFLMVGVIYLVAWSRIITILLYVSIAPIPFATFLNRDWIGSIGQSYVKNLLALMLQGYFMLVCLIIYAGLLEKVSGMMVGEGSAIYALLLMLVSMAILVITLTRTHSLAKSVVGAM